MDSFFVRFKNPLMLISIVLVQVIALAMQVQRPAKGFADSGTTDSSNVMLLRRWTLAVITPIERVVTGASTGVGGLWSNYIDLRHAREQDAALKSEIARLRQEQAAFAEDAAQGRRLQALLNFKQQYIAATVAAQVIGTSGTDRARVVYLDKGWADGLRPEQAVITPDGVVGKLRDVFPHSAQVLLISDPTSGAGVILVSTRIRGILRGTDTGAVQISNLTADSRIRPGEQVVTSGGDMVFPRGLPVGTIQSIAPDPQHQPYMAITLRTAANLSRLEEVLVITGTQTTLPPSAQQDAAVAQAAAAAAAEQDKQRAADLVAERLPSLHDTDTKPGPDGKPVAVDPAAANLLGGLPGVPNSGLPHTRAPLHPDRYSPGAAPPADELQPGARTAAPEPAPKPAQPDASHSEPDPSLP